MTEAEHDTKGQSGLVSAALFGLCPRCAARTVFEEVAQIAPRCRACGLDLERYQAGHRLSALFALVIAVLIGALAVTVQDLFRPPFWVHVLLWVPLTCAAVIAGLRTAKGLILKARYLREAERVKDQ